MAERFGAPTMVEDTRTKIRSIALDLFVRQGYDPTSLREIAYQVGITKASLYYHFPSKQALLAAIVEPLTSDLVLLADEVSELPWTAENIQSAIQRYLDMLLTHRKIARLLTRDLAAVASVLMPRLTELVSCVERTQTWLAGPEPTGPDQVRAQAALEAVGAALSLGILPGATVLVTDDELRETLLDVAMTILRKP